MFHHVAAAAAGDVVVVAEVDICHQVQLHMDGVLSSSSVHQVDVPSLPSPILHANYFNELIFMHERYPLP